MITLCSLWSTENVQWDNANWTWGECQTVQEVCYIWGQTGTLWKNIGVTWANANCTSSIPPVPVITIPNPCGVDATTLIQPWLEEPWNPYKNLSDEKKKRLIKLVCKVRGQKYEEEKELKEFTISIYDIQLVVKAVANIDLDLILEE